MNKDLLVYLKQFTDENFQGDQQKAEEFLIDYSLKHLGYINAPKIRKQRNINLGKLYGTRKEFLFEITDKVFRGKYATAIFELIEIALNYEKELPINKEILMIAKIKKEYDLEAMNRRATRKKDTPFIISYSTEHDELIESFYEFATNNNMKISECFSYLIGDCLKLYEEIDEA